MTDLTPESAYRRMAMIRRFEEKCMELKTQGEVPGSVHLAVGQEAIPVGACAELQDGDAVTATYRGHGWALARGSDPVQVLAEIMGRQSNLSSGRGGSPFFSDASTGFMGENSIVGAGLPIALGAAVDAWQRDRPVVSIVSIGDGALNQGGAHEALNFAAALELPLLVVVEDNIYSEMTPWKKMFAIDDLSQRVAGYGITAESVDGNNPFAVAEAVKKARLAAVSGGGPTVVIAKTARLVGHYSGDVQAYRPDGELEKAHKHEPLRALRAAVVDSRPHMASVFDSIDADVATEIDVAVERALAIPEPDPSSLEEHLYA